MSGKHHVSETIVFHLTETKKTNELGDTDYK